MESIKITVRNGESVDSVIMRLRREVNKSGHLRTLRNKRYHEDAREKKKRKVRLLGPPPPRPRGAPRDPRAMGHRPRPQSAHVGGEGQRSHHDRVCHVEASRCNDLDCALRGIQKPLECCREHRRTDSSNGRGISVEEAVQRPQHVRASISSRIPSTKKRPPP